MLFKHFMCTVYQTFHDECLKKCFQQNLNFFSYFINVLKTFPVIPSFLSYFINVFSKNVCIENVYKMLFKHYSINVYLETFRKPKIGFN